MTVQELIQKLSEFKGYQLVYVPSADGATDTVVSVCELVHLDLPTGIAIPNDVVLLPWTEEEFTRVMKGTGDE